MPGFPKSTELNRRIPKQKFYDNAQLSPAIKRAFVDQIRKITWKNKLSPATINLQPSEGIEELEVFEIQLNSNTINEAILRTIDKSIPYHILYVLEYEGKYQIWIPYKEKSANGSYKTDLYYHTDWQNEDDLKLTINGLTMRELYEGLVRQIAKDAIEKDDSQTSSNLKDSIERSKKKKDLEKKIAKLQAQVRKEKQFNKQVELNGKLKKLKKEYEKL
ncbi:MULTISPECIES: DUF4391 domain-containing protein [Erysipelotrichaceae]|uniref:DUF4391 domain-containing protein n=2 Tax=Erysipelotrichaceae TaxID=128827 RepID=A0A1U7NH16_9FIRM|nr:MULTISPECIES: DUF4391 domain-containing protein [Erysipelotrichaceae]OLU37270.1 hypothetical protein BM735_10645 [Erysipelotrichaceae bacterium NYU-BL-F16]OLU40777.1 hypothetical protein BO222_04220 [Ileibacterium valens]OLU41068.1 hypothetical protein BO224_04145 [Erysipelotrichaceae bacterium NYU-BL-E8]OLU44446.1 hypothetical protein BO223_08300 [Faecalibaculum rodentium]